MRELHITMSKMPVIKERINACIGYFDGLHKGHQTLIQAVINKSKENGATPALVTFEPDPWTVIKELKSVPHLTTMEERKRIAEALGVELWIILDFTKEMADLNVTDFHEQILNPLNLDTLVCGYDFHYAHYGKGNVESLQAQTKFSVLVIDEVSSEHEKISSTRIEQLITSGKMEQSEMLLTRPYQMQGSIVHGLKNGRKMGFPTANLGLSDLYVMPKEGVYAGSVMIDGQLYDAMINVGANPTFGSGLTATIEANLFDFDQDIYGKHVTFIFYSYLRGEVKYTTIDALIEQLTKDKEEAKLYLEKQRKEHPSCV